MDKKTAFVAMKFDKDPWNDKRYEIISSVLEEAGYDVERGDAFPTSAAVVQEVLDRLTNADLVVVDTSGNSHNVAYELGYCHGQERDPSHLILLRRKDEGRPPFNYAHYRYLEYSDLRHLKRLLRYRFAMSTPLTDSQDGHCLGFDAANFTGGPVYGSTVAAIVLDALEQKGFSGRCEYYAINPIPTRPSYYTVGLGLKSPRRSDSFDYKWFVSFTEKVKAQVERIGQGIIFVHDLSEMTSMYSIRASMLDRGVAELEKGKPIRLLSPHDSDSWFSGETMGRLAPTQLFPSNAAAPR